MFDIIAIIIISSIGSRAPSMLTFPASSCCYWRGVCRLCCCLWLCPAFKSWPKKKWLKTSSGVGCGWKLCCLFC